MILSAHQGFMPKRNPYDAEVEYLESTGTQYIDMGIFADNDFVIDFKVKLNQSNANIFGIFGVYVGTGGKACSVFFTNYASSRFDGVWDGQSIYSYALDDTRYDAPFVFHLDKTGAKINGEEWQNYNTRVINDSGLTMFLFGANGRGDRLRGRIYNFTIVKNGSPILDLIPVRKGDVGYMYDRVSGKLFGNSGTGAFVLGADK